jgi:hypothetical protein
MSTSTHPVAPEEIMALLEGELPGDRMESTAAHMEACAECRELAGTLHGASRLLSNWTIPPQPESFEFDGIVAEAASRVSSTGRSANEFRLVPHFRRHWILAAASSATATAALLMFGFTGTMRMAKAPQAHSHAVDLARTTDQISGIVEQPGRAGPEDRFSRAVGPSGSPTTLGRLEAEGRSLTKAIGANRPSQAVDQPKLGPMIARTVSLWLIATDFSSSRASLDAILARHHGYAASLTASTEQNSALSLTASLRIPAGELNAAVLELKSLGRVQNESQNGEEVTQQHADLVARLKNSRETEARLQDILRNRTGKISDILMVEQEIARVRGEIEQMEAEQKSLEHRVDFATVELKLSEEYKAHLGSPSPSVATRFHNALVAGYRDAAETIIGILLLLAEDGPTLLIWLLILVPIPWLLWRRWRRGVGMASAAL